MQLAWVDYLLNDFVMTNIDKTKHHNFISDILNVSKDFTFICNQKRLDGKCSNGILYLPSSLHKNESNWQKINVHLPYIQRLLGNPLVFKSNKLIYVKTPKLDILFDIELVNKCFLE